MRECVDLLYSASGQARLYGNDHPQTVRALDAMFARMGELLEWLGPLTFQASPEGLIWRGQTVAEERDDRVGVGRHLHTEGISEFTISPGVSRDEIQSFLSILRVNLSLPEFEEDTLESLFWQAQLQNISFKAVAELMDAEAVSGRMDDAARRHQEAIFADLIDIKQGDRRLGRDLGSAVASHDNHSADIGTFWDSGLPDEVDDEDWVKQFIDSAGEEREALIEIRESVTAERPADWLTRAIRILLLAAHARRSELPAKTALNFAVGLMRQLYVLGDPIAIFDTIQHAHAFSDEIRPTDPELSDAIRHFIKRTFSPVRVAVMLKSLDMTSPREVRVFRKLLPLLPDSAFVAFLDSAVRDEEPARHATLLSHAFTMSTPRLEKWLSQPDLPMEIALPMVSGLRLTARPEFFPARRIMLKHGSPAVREATVQWYLLDLPPDEERTVASMVLDRNASVREAAISVLEKFRPASSIRDIQKSLQGDMLEQLDGDRRIDLCIAFGKIGGAVAYTVLSDLLEQKGTMIGGDAQTTRAAALGLAALGTPQAIAALEKGARTIAGPRRGACQDALDRAEEQRRGNS